MDKMKTFLFEVMKVRSNAGAPMSMMELHVAEFAYRAHVGQYRKYTFEPYIVHPAEVASIVSQVSDDEDLICAAWLHDVIEDCGVYYDEIGYRFNFDIANIVRAVTNPSQINPELRKLNRKARKEADLAHYANASKAAKTLKLADCISNIHSIVWNDPGFAKVWVAEKALLLPLLVGGDSKLFTSLHAAVLNYNEHISKKE
jgi:(p)ppGpp synthase/HD superfamily hydrolase